MAETIGRLMLAFFGAGLAFAMANPLGTLFREVGTPAFLPHDWILIFVGLMLYLTGLFAICAAVVL